MAVHIPQHPLVPSGGPGLATVGWEIPEHLDFHVLGQKGGKKIVKKTFKIGDPGQQLAAGHLRVRDGEGT